MLAPVQVKAPLIREPHRRPLRPRKGRWRPLFLLPSVVLGHRCVRLRAAKEAEQVLQSLHPVLSTAVRAVLQEDTEMLMIGAKEEIGGVKGLALDGGEPMPLRQMVPKSYDLVVEVRSQELLCSSWEAVQNRFYPLGGHEFSLAKELIINLASILKVLRPGGRFYFLSRQPKGATVPFSFFELPHLRWRLEEVATGDATAWPLGSKRLWNAWKSTRIIRNEWKSRRFRINLGPKH